MHIASPVFSALVLSLLASPALAQTLTVKGPDKTETFTAEQLAALQHVTVTVGTGDAALNYEGVTLTTLLTRVGAAQGEALRGPMLTATVVVKAKDGYAILLSLSETDPGMRKETAIVADKRGGAALPANEGPFRLVVPGDLRQARSVRQTENIELKVGEGR